MVRSMKCGTKCGMKYGTKYGIKYGTKYGTKHDARREAGRNTGRAVNKANDALTDDAMSREEFLRMVENILKQNNLPVVFKFSDVAPTDTASSDAAPSDIALSDVISPDVISSDAESSDTSFDIISDISSDTAPADAFLQPESGVEAAVEATVEAAVEAANETVAEELPEKLSEALPDEISDEFVTEILAMAQSESQSGSQLESQSESQSGIQLGMLAENQIELSEIKTEILPENLPETLPEIRTNRYRLSGRVERSLLHGHGGHRQCMKEKVLGSGVESLADHELLEILLYYAVPRCDTNAMAHRLLGVYGSLAQVLEADYKDLQRQCGISPNTAFLLVFCSQLAGRYMRDRQGPRLDMSKPKCLSDYIMSLYVNQSMEVAYMLCLDGKHHLLNTIKLGEGTVGEVVFDMGEIVENAMRYRARNVILVHNHPAGSESISKADFELTKSCMKALSMIKVNLVDHIVVCGQETLSFSNKRYMAAMRQYVYGEIARKAKQQADEKNKAENMKQKK